MLEERSRLRFCDDLYIFSWVESTSFGFAFDSESTARVAWQDVGGAPNTLLSAVAGILAVIASSVLNFDIGTSIVLRQMSSIA